MPQLAVADIYEFIDEDGLTYFSDSPVDDRYVLILHEETIPSSTLAHEMINDKNLAPNKQAVSQEQLLEQIQTSAIANQLDSELIHAVIHVESSFKAQALSHKGAKGLMQLMPATAKRFGVSDPEDPLQNIEGGARYLRKLLGTFKNDLTLTLAAYNAGENAVIKYGYRIPPFQETQQYVPKVMQIYSSLLKRRQQSMKING